MSTPTFPAPSVVVATLRAAGCVFAEDEAELLISAADTPDALDAMVRRRVAGLPLEHVLGWAEFCGLRIALEPGVFVPRRRSEFLAGEAIAVAARMAPPVPVVDLCCGSGALATVLTAQVVGVRPFAADIDPVAVRCARANLPAERVFEGDLYEPLPAWLRGQVAVLVTNAPYVPTAEVGLMPAEARLHEARIALDGGPDGLDVQRRVIAQAPEWLAPGGTLLIETSERQAEGTATAATAAGLTARIRTAPDLDATVVLATFRP